GPLAVDELERIFEPAVGMHELAHRCALGAMRAAIERAVPARLLADPHVVLHLGRHRAADRAMRADVLAGGDRGAGARRRTRLGPAYAAERQGAERRQPRGDEARAAQERAAVEPAARLARHGGLLIDRSAGGSRRQCVGLRFDFDEYPAEHADAAVELRGLRALEVREEARGPRLDVLLEDSLVAAGRRRKAAAREPRHHFA